MDQPPPRSDVSMLSMPLSHTYYINNYSEVRHRLLNRDPVPLTMPLPAHDLLDLFVNLSLSLLSGVLVSCMYSRLY